MPWLGDNSNDAAVCMQLLVYSCVYIYIYIHRCTYTAVYVQLHVFRCIAVVHIQLHVCIYREREERLEIYTHLIKTKRDIFQKKKKNNGEDQRGRDIETSA